MRLNLCNKADFLAVIDHDNIYWTNFYRCDKYLPFILTPYITLFWKIFTFPFIFFKFRAIFCTIIR